MLIDSEEEMGETVFQSDLLLSHHFFELIQTVLLEFAAQSK